MNRKFFIAFICVLSCYFLLSCGDLPVSTATSTDKSAKEDESAEEKELERLSPGERKPIGGTPNGKNPQELEDHLSRLFETNHLGDTDFGEVIRFRSEEDALLLLSKLPDSKCQKLYHTNQEGESYVYLASKRGYSTLIRSIAKICFSNQGELWDRKDYEFYNLDPATKTGDKALHVAANVQVAKAIVYEYEKRKGELASPWSFYYHPNETGQTFLHKAVIDNRIDIVEWAVNRECNKSPSENDGGFWGGIVNYGKSLWQSLQARTTLNITALINKQDNEDNTALHLAASTLNEKAIRTLAKCRWVDYSSQNFNGDIPLQTFLKALDPLKESHEEKLKETFKLIVWSEDSILTKWLADPIDLVNHLNNDQDSSLHIAEKLADSFFYEHLQQFAHFNLKWEDDASP